MNKASVALEEEARAQDQDTTLHASCFPLSASWTHRTEAIAQRIGATNATSSVHCVQFYSHLNNSFLPLKKPHETSSKSHTGQYKFTVQLWSVYWVTDAISPKDTNCAI